MNRPNSKALARRGAMDMRRLAARQTLPMAIALVLVWLFWDRLQGLDMAGIGDGFRTVRPGQWLLALGFTGISFWAVGRYDVVVHRLTGTGVRAGAARAGGVTAIAVAQTAGFGVLTGALVRWRMLPEITLLQAMRLSLTVSVSFLAGWAVLAAVAVLVLPLPGATLPALAVLGAAALTGLLSLWRPRLPVPFHLPSLRAMTAIVILALIDTVAAGAALHSLLPAGVQIAAPELIAAFLLALGAGLLSGTPGGIGPFEVTLLTLMAGHPEEPLLAAILAFRIVYFALPAMLGAAWVIRGPRTGATRQRQPGTIAPLPAAPALPGDLAQTVDRAPRAEAALLRQGRLSVLRDANDRPLAMVAPSGQSLIQLSDPLTPPDSAGPVLAQLENAARARFLTPVIYKAGGRLSAAARRAGWCVLPIAREAWLNPQSFTLDGSARRQLRRKIRKALAAGVTVRPADPGVLQGEIAEMSAIARDWAQERCGERGFSMGVWNPAALPWSRLFLAYRRGRLIGFVTLHANPGEQTLDLMRLRCDAPDGTMHLLVETAIRQAGAAGCTRLSLAAVPMGRQTGEAWMFRTLRDRLDRASGAAGLRQFKAAFAPRWETLYMTAPTRRALVVAALDVMREITRRPDDPR